MKFAKTHVSILEASIITTLTNITLFLCLSKHMELLTTQLET